LSELDFRLRGGAATRLMSVRYGIAGMSAWRHLVLAIADADQRPH
jgi:hypothetical protein